MSKAALFAFLLNYCQIYSVSGWGAQTHRVVAAAVFNSMQPIHRNLLYKLGLPPGCDNIRLRFMEMNTEPDTKYPEQHWSQELHFAQGSLYLCQFENPFFDMRYNCGNRWSKGNCIVTALQNYTSRVANEDLNLAERQEALSFVLHFMADIHMPLHLGPTETAGGLQVMVRARENMNLHHIWDRQWAIDNMKRPLQTDDWSLLSETIWFDVRDNGKSHLLPELSDISSPWPIQIASETIGVMCRDAVIEQDGSDKVFYHDIEDLSEKYVENARRVYMQQISRTVARTLQLLEEIANTLNIPDVETQSLCPLGSCKCMMDTSSVVDSSETLSLHEGVKTPRSSKKVSSPLFMTPEKKSRVLPLVDLHSLSPLSEQGNTEESSVTTLNKEDDWIEVKRPNKSNSSIIPLRKTRVQYDSPDLAMPKLVLKGQPFSEVKAPKDLDSPQLKPQTGSIAPTTPKPAEEEGWVEIKAPLSSLKKPSRPNRNKGSAVKETKVTKGPFGGA